MTFKYESDTNDMRGGFSLVPVGIYTLIIVKVTEKTSKNGDPLVNAECEIDDAGPYLGKKIWHNVTFIPKGGKGAGMAVHFLKSIGEPFEGEIDVNPSNWIGKRFLAKLKIEEDSMGNPRNSIAFVKSDIVLPSEDKKMTLDQAIEKTKEISKDDDKIPF